MVNWNRIAVDMDDVIVDFGGRVVQTVNKEYGTHLTLDDVTDWNLGKLLDPIIGYDWWQWWESRAWLWATADAIDGAIGGLDKLHQMGYETEIVTATPDWAKAVKMDWLGKWRPNVDRIVFGKARPPMDKLAASDAFLIIDDKPDTVREWLGAGRSAMLFDRPHNLDATDLDAVRVFGWGHVLDNMYEYSTGHRRDVESVLC